MPAGVRHVVAAGRRGARAGRNVVLETSFGAPRITKDRVTVANEIELEDRFGNMGAQMVRELRRPHP